ncbi:hypothetical protein [Acidisoma silvae]|uniref:Uncharacterized protein n=1 Tax=Acidisoma silvae TaxID=2802396 RepID=A0A964E0X0_9PROT|nr:hypothetical protein [Acidisoma silvae]MCB8877607.1 hypothetical protein [Acidisoma silvae]
MTRAEAEELIQRAIDELNAIDGDTDLEPEGDCCAAGDDAPLASAIPWPESGIGADDDAEDSYDREEDHCDTEPDGWPIVNGPQDGCEIRFGDRP